MLQPVVMQFLRDLAGNNNREWFNQNKDYYYQAKIAFDELVDAQIAEISNFDPSVKGLAAKDCTFRIYRDTRFSHDKTPYKIHFGAYMAENGRKSEKAGYYFHVEPEASLIAGGIHCPQRNVLTAVRQKVYDDQQQFFELIEKIEFKNFFQKMEGKRLKTAPKGFDRNWPHIDWLKFQSYDFVHPLSDESLTAKDLLPQTILKFKALYPVNQFFNQVF